MPLLTRLMILALNIASGSIFLVKMERGNDVFPIVSIERESRFASPVGQRRLLIRYYSGTLAVSYDFNSLKKRNCVRN